MYQDGWIELATYSFPSIDDEPTDDSLNVVKSGGIVAYYGSYKESFVAANRALGRTTVEIGCWFGINTAIIFNNGTASTETSALLQWTATIITWNGVTIKKRHLKDVSLFIF
jgi:hypothetical protein